MRTLRAKSPAFPTASPAAAACRRPQAGRGRQRFARKSLPGEGAATICGLTGFAYNPTYMAATTNLSAKGQVLLPKALRTSRGWKPGTEFIVEERDGCVVLRPKQRDRVLGWNDLIGCVGCAGPRKTLKQMKEAVARDAKTHR